MQGASVQATQSETTRRVLTDPEGRYKFPELSDGIWAIHVEVPGFETLRRDVVVTSVPTDTERLADFSASSLQPIDPETGLPFSGTLRYEFAGNSSETVPFHSTHEDISGEAGISGGDRDPRNLLGDVDPRGAVAILATETQRFSHKDHEEHQEDSL